MFMLMAGSALLIAAQVPSRPQACAYDATKRAVVASLTPQIQYEAGKQPVFQGPIFKLGAETYEKYGRPRQLKPEEIRPYAKKGDAMMFIDAGRNKEVLYVLTSSAGCMFQPYARKA